MDIREKMKTGMLYTDAGEESLQKELSSCKSFSSEVALYY